MKKSTAPPLQPIHLLHFTGSTLHHIISGHHEKNANSVLFDPRTIELTATNDR